MHLERFYFRMLDQMNTPLNIQAFSKKQNATLRQQKERLSLLSELLSEEPQLVVPEHGSTLIVQKHHDAQSAGHYEAEETFNRMANRYYWTGMRKFITEEQRWIFLIEECRKMG
ncbi:hypothetical protein CEXT_663201 [Caerostris extrusa]|uniref:Integrase zinc-binding domain-containing protein n=1 Tax=Caerostris extrusa TaxID=172846 RepID=A0AAV4R092_CAEEX|nr:hypothetical protein CEXT_663201 [Caerostris extrusa]